MVEVKSTAAAPLVALAPPPTLRLRADAVIE
jgi:hypothetical protein